MKQILDLRQVYHRLVDRIRAHVILCWLALLIRIIENHTGDTWNNLRRELQVLHVCYFTGPPAPTTRPPGPPGTAAHPVPAQPGRAAPHPPAGRHRRLSTTRASVTGGVTGPARVVAGQRPHSGQSTLVQMRNSGLQSDLIQGPSQIKHSGGVGPQGHQGDPLALPRAWSPRLLARPPGALRGASHQVDQPP